MRPALAHDRYQPRHHLTSSRSQIQLQHPLVLGVALADQQPFVDQPFNNATDLPFVELGTFDDFLLRRCQIVMKDEKHAPMRQRNAAVTPQQVGSLRVQVGLKARQTECQDFCEQMASFRSNG